MPVGHKLKRIGKATEAILSYFTKDPEIAAAAGYIECAGSPAGVVTPDFIGQRCQDTVSGLFYLALSNTAYSWISFTPVIALVPNTVLAASFNSAALNNSLWSGIPAIVDKPGTYFHDRTIEPKSYSKLKTAPGVKLKLAPGASCNQIRNYYAQNAIDATTFISIASNVATVIEKGHNRVVGDQVYVENCQGNTTLNGVQTITEVGTNVNGFRYWKCNIASSAALTNDTYTRVFVSRYNPLAGSAFSRVANSATVTITNAAPGVVSWTAHPHKINDPVYFTTNGALPTGLTANTVYYVAAVLTSGTFTVSATPGGAPITTSSAGSGVHTAFARGTVTVAEPGHTKQHGDSVYIAGIPVVGRTFNGSVLITNVVAGVSWSYQQLGPTETGTGTANIQTDTGIQMDVSCLDYDAANNLFDQLWAVNVTLGNLANSECTFHQLIDGRSRAMQVFNGGTGMRIPKMISSSNSGASSKGTLQIESYAGDIWVGHVEQQNSTDDAIAWGITTTVAPFGGTTSPSGPLNLGTLTVGKVVNGSSSSGSCMKIFSTADNYDLGSVYMGDVNGSSGNGPVLQNLSPGQTCTMKALHIEMLRNVPGAAATQLFVTNWLRINSIRIGTLYDQQWSATRYTVSFDTTTVGNLHIGSLIMQQNRAAEIGIIFNTGTVIENFTTDSVEIAAQSGYAAVRVQGTAVVQNANHNGVRYVSGAIFTGDFYNCNSGGTVQTLNVTNYKGNNRSIYSAGVSGSATPVKLNLTNATVAGVVNDAATSQSGTVRLTNVEQATNGANMHSITGSGTWRIEGENVSHQTGLFCQLTTGSASVSINCADAKIDMGASAAAPPARLVPLAGDQITNTNATGGGVYGRTVAGAWQLLY